MKEVMESKYLLYKNLVLIWNVGCQIRMVFIRVWLVGMRLWNRIDVVAGAF